MTKRKMTAAERFFFDNTMVAGVGRLQAARELAHAETVAAHEEWECVWVNDDLPYEIDEGCTPREVLCAVLKDAAGNILASLGGIGDPSDDYRREVAAELASEALERAADLVKRARKAVRK